MNSQVLPCRNELNTKSPVSWVLVGFVLFVTLRLAFLGPNMLADPDTYLHVAVGDWIREHGEVPLTDPFSYPMAGQPWIAHEWLAGLVMSYAYTLGGWYGVCVLTVMALGLTLVILARFLLKHLPAIYAFLLVVMANNGLESHLLARPHVLVWPLTALWVSKLLMRSEDARPPPFWLLPILVVWSNFHGSFILGLSLVVPLALEACSNSLKEHRVRVFNAWLLFFLLGVVGCLLTPYGLDGLALAGKLASIKSLENVGEWQPLTVNGQPFAIVMVGVLLVLGLRGLLTLPWIRLLLVLGIGWQMFAHARFFSIFALLMPLLIAAPLASSQRSWPNANQQINVVDRFFEYVSGSSTALAWVLGVFMISISAYQFRQVGLQPRQAIAPTNALAYLKSAGLVHNGLNHYNYGGFLIWSGIKVFMDGRVDLRGDEGMSLYDQALHENNAEALVEILEEYQVGWTMFPPKSAPIAHLDQLPNWSKAYADDYAVIHVRSKNN